MIFQLFPEICTIVLSLLFTHTRKSKYGYLLAGCVLNIVFGLVLKQVSKKLIPLIGKDIVLRPDDAFGCNMNHNVSNKGEIGMPSNHSMLAGYMFSKFYPSPLAFGFAVIPFTRLRNDQFPIFNHGDHACHTWGQITIGFILGIAFSRYY